MNNVVVFMHVAAVNQYQQVFEEVFGSIIDSGLLNESDKINICVVGNGDLMLPESDNIEVYFDPTAQSNPRASIEYGEFHTLTHLKNFCDSVEENTRVLYCHLRGVTSPGNQHISTWRKYLTHWNINKFRSALEDLKQCDACGVDLIVKDRWPHADHFSGNFWWANSDYIKKLPSISEISNLNSKKILTLRHNAEFWIGMGNGNLKSMHDVDVDVCSRHLISCPEENYQ